MYYPAKEEPESRPVRIYSPVLMDLVQKRYCGRLYGLSACLACAEADLLVLAIASQPNPISLASPSSAHSAEGIGNIR